MGKKVNKKKKKRKKLEKIIVEEKIKQNFYKILFYIFNVFNVFIHYNKINILILFSLIPISNKTKIKQKLLNFVSLTIPLLIL